MAHARQANARRGAGARRPPISLQQRLHEKYELLPDSERKIADLVLDFPGEVAAYNATELATLAGASKAAVTRLVRRLGYASFAEARRAARDARDRGSPLYMLHSTTQPEGFEARVRAHVARDTANLGRTLDGLDRRSFEDVVDALAEARRVWLVGYRNSHHLAGYTRGQLLQVRDEVHLLPVAGETLAEYVDALRPEDMLVVIAFRRRVPVMERVMDLATGRGTRVLAITDTGARLRARPTWTLRCEVRGEDLFDRYTAAISVLHLLSVELARRTGAAGRRRLARIEDLHETLDELG